MYRAETRPFPVGIALKAKTMFYALLKTVHVLSILLWVGGMIFAHFFCVRRWLLWRPLNACNWRMPFWAVFSPPCCGPPA